MYVSLDSTTLEGHDVPSWTSYASTRVCIRHAPDTSTITHSPSIDRFVVADGRAWRAASPTRLRVISTGAALASALQPYAVAYSPSSLLGRDFTREGGTGGRHASERAKCGGMGCRWQCYDMVTWHEYLYPDGGVAVGTALTDLPRYQQLTHQVALHQEQHDTEIYHRASTSNYLACRYSQGYCFYKHTHLIDYLKTT